MKRTAFLLVVFLSSSVFAKGGGAFPQNPNPQETPGSLCTRSNTYRYPERVRYCERDVESELKRDIIRTYDERFGYSIGQMDRMKFKIDHLIPLCAGGSNDRDNLWPQHESVYNVTDPLEPLICEKMSQGRLQQAEAVRLIRAAKADLRQVQEILRTIESM